MRKFIFRLQVLRRLTEAKERAQAGELAQKENARRRTELEAHGRSSDARRVEAEFRAVQSGGDLDPARTRLLLRRLEDADTRTRHAEETLARETSEADQAKDALAKEIQARKTLDRLHDRHRQAHDRETGRDDERELDDLINRGRGPSSDSKDRAA
jgi:flagellar export protein FliJ